MTAYIFALIIALLSIGAGIFGEFARSMSSTGTTGPSLWPYAFVGLFVAALIAGSHLIGW